MNDISSDSASLLRLPDELLSAVLQSECFASDPASLANAARTHSRLNQLYRAVLVPGSSITANIADAEQMDSLLLYLEKHGQHVDSLALSSNWDFHSAMLRDDSEALNDSVSAKLWQVPANQQLQSLACSNLFLDPKRSAADGFQKVLAAGAPLKKLQLSECLVGNTHGDRLYHSAWQALAAALTKLPALEHLSITDCYAMYSNGTPAVFDVSQEMFDSMQQLTYLELIDIGSYVEEPKLSALTGLVDLRLHFTDSHNGVTSDMLLGVSSLTRLELSAFDGIDAGVLAEKPLLQHLALPRLDTDPLELMSQLQNMQQLTYLDLSGSDLKWGSPPAAAYAALTASSRLQHLDISSCQVRVGFWQHMFPAGRQLPSLRS